MVIGVTDEDPKLVEKWIAKTKATFPIVATDGSAFEGFLGVKGFPTAAVVGPEGRLDWVGSAGATSGPVSKAMSGAKKGPIWPKKLGKCAKQMQAGELGKAYGTVLALLEGGKLAEGEELDTGNAFKIYLEDQAAYGLAAGRASTEVGRIYDAVRSIEPFCGAKPAFPASADCETLLAELKAMPTFKKEMKGGELLKQAEGFVGERVYMEAVDLYKKVMKTCKGTKVAELAEAGLRSLIESGMPGYRSVCDVCSKLRRACEKHAEDIKL